LNTLAQHHNVIRHSEIETTGGRNYAQNLIRE